MSLYEKPCRATLFRMSPRNVLAIAGIGIALTVLPACSGGSPVGSPSAAQSSSGTAVTYDTVAALKDAAVSAGYPCASWTEDDAVAMAKESGSCSDADVFSIYASIADRDAVVSTLKSISDVSETLLVGPNWIINSSDAWIYQSALGGEVVRSGSTAADTPTPTPSYYIPVPSDFTITVKITSKQCFGSAGCNVKFRIVPKYHGDSNLPPTGTLEVTYDIKGAEDPYTNSFTIEGDTVSYPSEEFVSTKTTKVNLKVVVTDVSYLDN